MKKYLIRSLRAFVMVMLLIISTVLPATIAPDLVLAEPSTLFSENFDGMAAKLPSAKWTHTPPTGWKLSNDPKMPQGDAPWQGWSLTTLDVWKAADVGIQARDEFTKARGVFAIADPDEWDDRNSPSSKGTFNSTLATPSIDVAGADNLKLTFDSHWRPDGSQTGLLLASFDGGTPVELLRYDSKNTDDSGKFRNQTVTKEFNVPDGASKLVLSWQLLNAKNNWYWAIDNIALTGDVTQPAPTPTNLALNKTTSQSSNAYGSNNGIKAVDGKTDGNYSHQSVTHTGNNPQEWWQVDLGDVYDIDSIRVYNRTDCCGERLSNFAVMVASEPFPTQKGLSKALPQSTWSQKFSGTAGVKEEFQVKSSGRYVRIQLAGINYLSLAEVEVFGTPAQTPVVKPTEPQTEEVTNPTPTCDGTLAEPVVVFEDEFEEDSLKYGTRSLARWNVTSGNVDVHGQAADGSSSNDVIPGHGTYLDLSGSPGIGTIATKETLVLTPGTYKLSFDVAHPRENSKNTYTVKLGNLFDETFPMPSKLTTIEREIEVSQTTEAQLIFINNGPDTVGGVLLVQVSLSKIVDPESCGTDKGVAIVVNIDPTQNHDSSTAVTRNLPAGEYKVEVIGTAQGGQFDAWSRKCNCKWDTYYSRRLGSSGPKKIGNPNKYNSKAEALANRVPSTSFTLTDDTDVKFYTYSTSAADNIGGVSMQVEGNGIKQSVDLDATQNVNKDRAEICSLPAGDYTVTLLGTAEGGKYDAWSSTCSKKWRHAYKIRGDAKVTVAETGVYPSAGDALAHRPAAETFRLDRPGEVKFYTYSASPENDCGGVSLNVTRIGS